MNPENALEIYNKLESDSVIQNFISQGSSRYILLNVDEPPENFPKYTNQIDTRLDNIAFAYISAGCRLFESNELSTAINALTKGAQIIEFIHRPIQSRKQNSPYFLLISSLAYYSANQYSKSFILLNEIEQHSKDALIISSFLKKDFSSLIKNINSVLLADNSIGIEDENDLFQNFISFLIAKIFSNFCEYSFSGEQKWFEKTHHLIQDLLDYAEINNAPTVWWIAKLLIILSNELEGSSTWNNIVPIIGNMPVVENYILGLAFNTPPMTELFSSQKNAIAKVSSDDGSIISIPTSSGKTRIAEISILDNFVKKPESIVLYLAPFRSLAFEIEEALERTLSSINCNISHLYGGGQYSRHDKLIIEESNVIIATPEKAKAIIRSDKEVASKISLVIIDEGHLIGAEQRFIQNEIFIEELKFIVKNNSGKYILLSAVLPNAEDISKWITNKSDNIVTSQWRPSSQRLGFMEWDGENININWVGEFESFNRNFIAPFIPKKKRTYFPNDKKTAVAASAIKFSKYGTVLIFVGRSNMVLGQAQAVLVGLGENPPIHKWQGSREWEAFELSCQEAYGPESEVLNYAKYGVICHNSQLPSDVRYSIEKLMRKEKPRIIISTSTLGQGVNIGISTVIFANVYISSSPIGRRDFWNIAGRAGRAFIDTEGKILYTIDKEIISYEKFKNKKKYKLSPKNEIDAAYNQLVRERQYQIRQSIKLAKKYFDQSKIEPARSGLLRMLEYIHELSKECNIQFSLLLELISDNSFSQFDKHADTIPALFEWIDDSLLALNLSYESYNNSDMSEWIDDHFRASLAYIQAQQNSSLSPENVIDLIKARNKAVLRLAGNHENWNSIVSTGIPLLSSLEIDSHIDNILAIISEYSESNQNIEELVRFSTSIENIVNTFPSEHFNLKWSSDEISVIRNLWYGGIELFKIVEENEKNGQEICVSYFGFNLPWGINAIAKRLNILGYEDETKQIEDLAILSEMGLPNILATKIYLSGIRSRTSSVEISQYFPDKYSKSSVQKIKRIMIANLETLKENCSEITNKWLSLINEDSNTIKKNIDKINNFVFKKGTKVKSNRLVIRQYEDKFYVVSCDYEDKININISSELPFDKVANDLGVYFELDTDKNNWVMKSRNPYLRIKRNKT
jgi:superfamily II DNA/RNA helicase